MAYRTYFLHRETTPPPAAEPADGMGAQEKAWRGLCDEHGATRMRRRVHENGDITLTLFDHEQGDQPTHTFTILRDGKVREYLMAPEVVL